MAFRDETMVEDEATVEVPLNRLETLAREAGAASRAGEIQRYREALRGIKALLWNVEGEAVIEARRMASEALEPKDVPQFWSGR